MKIYEVYTTDGYETWAERYFLKEETAQQYKNEIAEEQNRNYLETKIAEIEVHEE